LEDRITLQLGDKVWIPCDVTHSVFPDERNVSIVTSIGHWTGFVDVRQLRDEIPDGKTAIRATIVQVTSEQYSARLPGQTTPREYLSVPTAQRWRFEQA
jgi:hypothetical protein